MRYQAIEKIQHFAFFACASLQVRAINNLSAIASRKTQPRRPSLSPTPAIIRPPAQQSPAHAPRFEPAIFLCPMGTTHKWHQ
jgi:hypothetical protein